MVTIMSFNKNLCISPKDQRGEGSLQGNSVSAKTKTIPFAFYRELTWAALSVIHPTESIPNPVGGMSTENSREFGGIPDGKQRHGQLARMERDNISEDCRGRKTPG